MLGKARNQEGLVSSGGNGDSGSTGCDALQ